MTKGAHDSRFLTGTRGTIEKDMREIGGGSLDATKGDEEDSIGRAKRREKTSSLVRAGRRSDGELFSTRLSGQRQAELTRAERRFDKSLW